MFFSFQDLQKIKKEIFKMTNVLFLKERILNDFYETYDIAKIDKNGAVMFKQLFYGGKE